MQVPDLDREVVPRDHVTAGVGEFHVGDGGDYLGEEAAIRRVFWLLEHFNEEIRSFSCKERYRGNVNPELTFGVSITERGLPHVAEADGSLARGVNKEVAFARMELAGSDHLQGKIKSAAVVMSLTNRTYYPESISDACLSLGQLAATRTSVSSSMLAGLMSTMLKDWSVISMCHRLMRRSSAERYVSPSEFTLIELMW